MNKSNRSGLQGALVIGDLNKPYKGKSSDLIFSTVTSFSPRDLATVAAHASTIYQRTRAHKDVT